MMRVQRFVLPPVRGFVFEEAPRYQVIVFFQGPG